MKKNILKHILCSLGAVMCTGLMAGLPQVNSIAAEDHLVWKVEEEGKSYWYENGVRQGTYDDKAGVMGDGSIRGREIYDPESDAWYWLDSCYNGAKAVNKEVWIPYIYQDDKEISTLERNTRSYDMCDLGCKLKMRDTASETGKWVRYDENGRMIKGWYTNENGTYYYESITGTMMKGKICLPVPNCDEEKYMWYYFDEVTGVFTGQTEEAEIPPSRKDQTEMPCYYFLAADNGCYHWPGDPIYYNTCTEDVIYLNEGNGCGLKAKFLYDPRTEITYQVRGARYRGCTVGGQGHLDCISISFLNPYDPFLTEDTIMEKRKKTYNDWISCYTIEKYVPDYDYPWAKGYSAKELISKYKSMYDKWY